MSATGVTSLLAGAAIVVAAAAGATGCGGAEDDGRQGSPAPARSAFPAADGRTLEQIASDVGLTDDVVASPAGRVYRPGANRFGFGFFTVEREQIEDAQVAIYAAPGPAGEARAPALARIEPLTTEPAFVAETTAADPDAAVVLYVSRLRLPTKGEWRLLAVVREPSGALRATRMPSIVVKEFPSIPAPREGAPLIHTPTVDDVGSVEEIETRVPPDTMHQVDFADALGDRAIVLLFATPALCQSRVCGPVVDIAEQVHRDYDDEDVAFIHMEVYEENSVDDGIRPQLEAFGLPTEPWLFVIDERGRVTTALEGGFSVAELSAAVDDALR